MPAILLKKKCCSNFQAQEREIHQNVNQIEKFMQYSVAVPSTREENSPIPDPILLPVRLDSMQLAMLALQLRVKKNGNLPTNPTDFFNFVVDTCWRANTPVLMTQISEMYTANEKQVEEAHEPTTGSSHWFSDNPEWLILALV